MLASRNQAIEPSVPIATAISQGRCRGQLERLLNQALFHPERWDAALFMPPWGRNPSFRASRAWERDGHRAWPRLAGVHIVEATKSLYALAPVGKVRKMKPVLAHARN